MIKCNSVSENWNFLVNGDTVNTLEEEEEELRACTRENGDKRRPEYKEEFNQTGQYSLKKGAAGASILGVSYNIFLKLKTN